MTSFVASLPVYAFLLFGATVSLPIYGIAFVSLSLPGNGVDVRLCHVYFSSFAFNSIGYCSAASLERNTPTGNCTNGQKFIGATSL